LIPEKHPSGEKNKSDRNPAPVDSLNDFQIVPDHPAHLFSKFTAMYLLSE
jgi:hypothetical protein